MDQIQTLYARKGNQSTLHEDVKNFLADAELAKPAPFTGQPIQGTAASKHEPAARRRRAERTTPKTGKIHAKRISKKTRQTSVATRFEMTPLAIGPAAIRAAARGDRKQFALAVGHNVRRGSLPDKKRLTWP